MSIFERLPFRKDKFGVQMLRNRGIKDQLKIKGEFFNVEHWRNGLLLARYDFKNLAVNAGKNYLLDAAFNGITQITTWYFGLIDNNGFTAIASTDVMNSHPGWTEWQSYSETTRQTWNKSAQPTSTETITTVTAAVFTMSAAGILAGAFIASNSTKGGTSGTLWSAGQFAATVSVAISDQMRVNYSVAL